jgi:hypothetical protein
MRKESAKLGNLMAMTVNVYKMCKFGVLKKII